MRKFFISLTVIVLVVSFSVTALAVDTSRSIFYLYRDFKPVTQNEDGTIVRRLTLDPGNMFGSVSSPSSSNFFRQIGMQQFSFEGEYGNSYWVNIDVLGVFSDDIYDSSIWNKKNLISLEGFLTGAKLNFLYRLTGANIEDDHHDIWISYYDSNFIFTEQIQYQGTLTSVGNQFFAITDIPIGVGSNLNNAYFSVMLQIDDIYPEFDGSVTLSLTGMTINTTGTASGSGIWEPIKPDMPDRGGLAGVNDADKAIGDLAQQFFAGFDSFSVDYPNLVSSYAGGFRFLSTIITDFLNFEVYGVFLTFSVVWGVIAFIYGVADFNFSRSRQPKKKIPKSKGKELTK